MFGSKRFLWTITLVSVLLAPFVLFTTPLKPWIAESGAATAVQEILYPVSYAWHYMTTRTLSLWRHYVALTNAAHENTELKTEVALLRSRTSDYDERVHESQRLRKLLELGEQYNREYIVAEVVGAPRDLPFTAMRLAKGQNDGIRIGMPVLAADGVVGRVIRTGQKFSDVQLLIDSNMHIDVLLQRTRVRGVLRGMSHDRCKLNLHRRAEIKIGDTVITSGIIGAFPKGLPVGRVVRISYEADNVTQVIAIEPWVDYTRLEEVMILKRADLEIEKIADAAGEEWLRKTIDQADGG